MKLKRKFKKILKNKIWYFIVGVIVLAGAFFSNCENTEGFRIKNIFNSSSPSNKEDISAELNTNGRTLVDTLQSFNVQTNIVDISRGPAVTRYEDRKSVV